MPEVSTVYDTLRQGAYEATRIAAMRGIDSEVFWESGTEIQAVAKNGSPPTIAAVLRSGIAMRTQTTEGPAFGFLCDPTQASIERMADTLTGVDSASYHHRFEHATISSVNRTGGESADAGEAVQSLRHIALLIEAAREGARSAGARKLIVRVWHRRRTFQVVGRGAFGSSSGTQLTHLSVHAYGHGSRGYANLAAGHITELTESAAHVAGSRAARESVRMSTAVSPPSGEYYVVFSPAASAVLVHELVGHALEADTALSGSALWHERGRRVTHAAVTVLDDPGLPGAWEQVTHDEEGAVCGPARLIHDSVVTGVVSDRTSARQLSLSGTTGHCRRGLFTFPPAPRVRHTAMLPGPDDPADITGDTDHGVFVDAIESADAIPGTGQFTLCARAGREIHRGRLGRPLRDFSICGDLGTLRAVDAVGTDSASSYTLCGRDGHWPPVSFSAPTVRACRATVLGVAASGG